MATPEIPYKELKARLKKLRPRIGKINLTLPYEELRDFYDKAIANDPSILDEFEPPMSLAEAVVDNYKLLANIAAATQGDCDGACPAPPPKEEKKVIEKSCRVCGGKMVLQDGWFVCESCPNREFNR